MKKTILLIAFTYAIGEGGFAQNPGSIIFDDLFCPIDTTWAGDSLIVPQGSLQYDILLREGDIAHNLEKANNAALKGGFGSVYYENITKSPVSINGSEMQKSTEGWLSLSLRDNKTSILGDGGGLLRMRVKEGADGGWEVVPQTEGGTTYNYRFFDLDAIGGSMHDDGFHLGYQSLSFNEGMGGYFMLERPASSNASIAAGIADTSNFTLPAYAPGAGTSIPRYQNMGWVVQVNKNTGIPEKKIYAAGRGDFGGLRAFSSNWGEPMLEQMYYVTRTQPAVFLQYDGWENKIYAYQQDSASYEGQFILLNELDVDGSVFPFTFEELLDIQKIALQKGATMFNRLGSIAMPNGIDGAYIAETGGETIGDAFTNPSIAYNGKLAWHLQQRQAEDGGVSDPYGRILKVTTVGEKIKIEPLIEGCVISDERSAFSNPKQIQVFGFQHAEGLEASDKAYLIINEEVPDAANKKNPATVAPEDIMNETYFLNLAVDNPGLNDLRPFAIGPKGAEIQSIFSIEGMSPMFFSIRYPSSGIAPYDKSLLIAVNNFEAYFTNPQSCGWVVPEPGCGDTATVIPPDTSTAIPELSGAHKGGLEVWPNPASRTLYFAEMQAEIKLYDVNGRLIYRREQAKELNIFDLQPGIYYLRNDKGQTKKIVIQ